MKFISAFFRLIIGAVFGIASVLALSPALAAFSSEDGDSTNFVMLGVVALCALLGVFAPTIRRAFGRGFLLLGASTFALPISTFLLSGRVASDTMASTSGEEVDAASAIGAGLAGVAMTGMAAFIGLIMGAIFLLIGLILSLGGRREVVIVERK
ncbi:hypothetical protein CCR90_08145 [Rhodovulum sulfidophilum]|uniref:Uncharacterized protein n=1 Tax=Rhodovulum sulfidophilum TaxID=35806 RepID=A0A0D6B281_RHOSU|nr:hypothetical protein [Rhodovulum sulfidophilum]MBK5923753.1 hypothetical protein [Rhodovulum sulfidophilum]BAQ69192.1 hypothetical protein NHU_02037 [Rhodovulum sulfidophilum]